MNLPFKLTLDVSADSEEIMEDEFAKFLRTRGYHVASPHERWERFGAFCDRLGLKHDTVHRRIAEWSARGNVVLLTYDARNYVKDIRTNPVFDAYCLAHD